jgi:SNF2 family DNA or RNA helicase
MPRLSLVDFQSSFEPNVLKRGEDYLRLGQVVEVAEAPDGIVIGRVSGSDPMPYSVRLIIRQGARPHIVGKCTCPVGQQCKHCAAVGLAWLSRPSAAESNGSSLPPHLADWLALVASSEPDPMEEVEDAKYRAFYVLALVPSKYLGLRAHIKAVNCTVLKNGGYGTVTEVKASSIDNRQFAKHFNTFDRALLTDLAKNGPREDWAKADFRLDSLHGARLLKEALKSERCYWGSVDGPLLRESGERRGRVVWESDRKGEQTPTLAIDGGGAVLPLSPPWYVDMVTGDCGPVETGMASALAFSLLTAPPVAPEFAQGVRRALPDLGVPVESLPVEPLPVERLAPKPIPKLDVEVVFCDRHRFDYWRKGKADQIPIPFARLTFVYGDAIVTPSDRTEIRKALPDRIQIITRDAAFESSCQNALAVAGWVSPKFAYLFQTPPGRATQFCLAPTEEDDTGYLDRYRGFLQDDVGQLRKEGWLVEAAGDFRILSEESVDWDIGIAEGSGTDWFEFKLAVRIDGRELPLRPILLELLRVDAPSVDRFGRRVPTLIKRQDRYITLDGGIIIRLSPERIAALLQPLTELFGNIAEWPDELRLPKSRLLEAEELARSVADAGLKWKSPEELQVLGSRLKEFSRLVPLGEPEGFQAILREYQQEGLAWLQFLREYGFGGILADDMGLGKTVQVLAHIQIEKLEGRLDSPCLVVAPTSTLPNWRREAEKFTPGLRVHVHHGPQRKGQVQTFKDFDIVVTNYALLTRDRAELVKESFHMVVLDEAQNVKNATSAAAKAARDVQARHKLCLSGTPIENHLDELWSLFHFLMPGFLDNITKFRQRFRVPIEQKNDPVARERLSKMVRPFMLRRTKQQVATELPPKTEILETVELGEKQRELYETLRLAMDERIRGLLAAHGLAKSRIQVLDALLKLRQVCCDPRLVKLEAARTVTESAKLDRLVEMLEVLIEDGRKVLLFSQFTSMLDLIEERLKGIGLRWVRITGDTKDRETPVRQFEGGEVPLFLISLKAGGTGLNLVAADTVIHYDPWWNPAVENQATDRAYRIGQDKPVMVYKLVVAGTVEEKILELQKRKGDIAASILSDSERAEAILDADDLSWLLSN